MTYSCAEPRCRWAAHNGPHPNQLHAVWWGCTKRPARPYAPGDLVVNVHDPEATPYPVDHLEWDDGRGWHVVVRYRDDQWGLVRHEPTELRLAHPSASHTQPALFDLLETT
jgi:hypothetical protein